MLTEGLDLKVNQKFKGLTEISSKESLVANKKSSFKILCVFRCQLLPISQAPQTRDFHLAEPTLLDLPKAHGMAPFHLVNVPQ